MSSVQMNVLINGKGLVEATLDVHTEQIDVTTMTEPDMNWTLVDAAGHMHAWSKDGTLPTLELKERLVEVVPDDEFTVEYDNPAAEDPDDEEDWDDEGEFTVTEYHCRICDEVIHPRSHATTSSRYKPGRKSWEVKFRALAEDVFAHRSELVSVWTEVDGKMRHFGVGRLVSLQLVSLHAAEGRFADGVVVGIGELGTR